MLAALRKGWAARGNIAAKQPVRLEVLPLPDQSLDPTQAGFEWTSLRCTEASFSTCGQWIAVVLEGRQRCSFTGPAGRHELLYVHDVVILSTTEGFPQQARFCTGSSIPDLHWACAAPRLGIALMPPAQSRPSEADKTRQEPCGTAASIAFVVDAPVGEVLHRLSCQTFPSFTQLCNRRTCQLLWSPDCRFLLVSEQSSKADGLPGAGQLSVFDVVHDRKVATSSVVTQPGPHPAALWHPNSQAVVLSSHFQLESTVSFARGGIAMGSLPQPMACTVAGFSADGLHLVARCWSLDRQGDRAGHAVLSCSADPQQLCFAVERELNPVPESVSWVPHSSSLLLQMRWPSRLCYVVDVSSGLQHTHALAEPLRLPAHHFTPSGRVLVEQDPGGLRLIDLNRAAPSKVQQLLESVRSALTLGRGTGLFGRGRDAAKLHGSEQVDMQNLGLAAGTSFWCRGWLPSGQGLVCSASLTRDKQPPSLHIYWFV